MKARAIQQAAAEAAAAAAAAAAEKANRPLLEAKALDATAIKFGKLVASDEAKLAKGAHKTLAVIIGEHLTLKQLKPHELVQQWAKRGEEPISKMEFRQHIRKMLEQTDVREIDALFERLDEDGGGTLDVDEMRHALKTLQQSAAKGAAEAADTEKRVRHNRKRHDAARHAADLMRKMDQAKRDADLVRSGKIPLRDKLSAFLIDPGKMKMSTNETVTKWDEAGNNNGLIGKDVFRTQIAKLMGIPDSEISFEAQAAAKGPGEVTAGKELDDIFESFDADQSGDLNVREMKAVLRRLYDEGKQVGKRSVQVEKRVKDCKAVAKEAQDTLQALLDEDAAAAAEVQARKERERLEKLAAKEAAKAAKAAKEEAKAAEAAAKKLEFEQRVSQRRK